MRLVIDPEVLLRLGLEERPLDTAHELVAPVGVRSRALEILLGRVQAGMMSEKAALDLHRRITEIKIRALNDRVSRATAWKLALAQGWNDLREAEYLAVLQLQADVLVAESPELLAAASQVGATMASYDALFGSSSSPTLQVHAPVLGVDASPGGWVGVCLQPDRPPFVAEGSSISALVEHVREQAPLTVVAIDIPIGLPDSSSREADRLARKAVPGKGASVFSTLTRVAYEAPTYAEARAANIAATGGTSASAQAYGLRAKILEVDAWLRLKPAVEVIEVHPEVSFAAMAGVPIAASKKTAEGVAARRAALETAGLVAPRFYRGSGFGEDDLLDACAAAWTAARHSSGDSESFPVEPEVFSDGLPAAIWR